MGEVDLSTGAAASVTVLAGRLDASAALSSVAELLHWASTAPGAPAFTVTALHHGPERARLERLAPTHVVYDPHGWTVPRLAQRVGLRRASAALRTVDLRRRLRTSGPVYVVGAEAGRLLHWTASSAGPVVTHLHADAPGVDRLAPPDRDLLVARTDRWIVAGDDRRDELAAAGVAPDRIHRLPDVLPFADVAAAGPSLVSEVRAELQRDHGIRPDAQLVIGGGNVDSWEVPDAFVRIAWEAARRPGGDDLAFLWIADGATERMLWPLRHDIAHAGLQSTVHVSTAPRPVWHVVAASAAVLHSRLGGGSAIGGAEASVLGVPVVRFDDEGGADERGERVAHLDIDAMAERLLAVATGPRHPFDASDPQANARLGLPSVVGPRILELLGARLAGEPIPSPT